MTLTRKDRGEFRLKIAPARPVHFFSSDRLQRGNDMHVTFCKYRNKLLSGNTLVCLSWAVDKAKEKNIMIQVYSVRPGSKEAELFAEVSRQGIRLVPSGTFARIQKSAIWENL